VAPITWRTQIGIRRYGVLQEDTSGAPAEHWAATVVAVQFCTLRSPASQFVDVVSQSHVPFVSSTQQRPADSGLHTSTWDWPGRKVPPSSRPQWHVSKVVSCLQPTYVHVQLAVLLQHIVVGPANVSSHRSTLARGDVPASGDGVAQMHPNAGSLDRAVQSFVDPAADVGESTTAGRSSRPTAPPRGQGGHQRRELALRLRNMVTRDIFVTMKAKRRQIPAGEFKAKCLALFDEVETSRLSFVVTKRGRPVARVVPLSADPSSSLRGSVLHEEDLLAPVDVEWNAQH
jgi:prevent-host-death family protein